MTSCLMGQPRSVVGCLHIHTEERREVVMNMLQVGREGWLQTASLCLVHTVSWAYGKCPLIVQHYILEPVSSDNLG